MSNNTLLFDCVKSHALKEDANMLTMSNLCDDLELLTRKCDEVRGLSREYGSIELSPYMRSLLGVPEPLSHQTSAVSMRAVASV